MRTNHRWTGLSVSLGLAAAIGSCAPLQSPAYIPPTSGPPGFVSCDEPAGSSAKRVGPPGDTLVIEVPRPTQPSRTHILRVPEDAVKSGQIQFTLTNIVDGYVGVRATANPATVFDPAVKLRLSYAGCAGAADADSLQVYRWQSVGPINWDWVPIGGNHNRSQQWVEVDRSDLSDYALGST